jgi:hypothetical protein
LQWDNEHLRWQRKTLTVFFECGFVGELTTILSDLRTAIVVPHFEFILVPDKQAETAKKSAYGRESVGNQELFRNLFSR